MPTMKIIRLLLQTYGLLYRGCPFIKQAPKFRHANIFKWNHDPWRFTRKGKRDGRNVIQYLSGGIEWIRTIIQALAEPRLAIQPRCLNYRLFKRIRARSTSKSIYGKPSYHPRQKYLLCFKRTLSALINSANPAFFKISWPSPGLQNPVTGPALINPLI